MGGGAEQASLAGILRGDRGAILCASEREDWPATWLWRVLNALICGCCLSPTRYLGPVAPPKGRGEGLDVHLELLSLSSCSCSWIPWRSALRTGGSSHHPSSHNCSVVVCNTCFVCAGLLCVVGRDGGEGEGRHGEGSS